MIAVQRIPELGVAVPELGWVPSPTFALRRQAILDRVRSWPRGRVLEMGCGAGVILSDRADLGFTGVGVETSEKALGVAAAVLRHASTVCVTDTLPEGQGDFDYLISFEVLEHIEYDHDALASWVSRLRQGGACLLSVPAHPDRWNVTDVLAGHYRRYEKDQIVGLMTDVGLQPTYVSTYGWPATWLIERVRCAVRMRQLRRQGVNPGDIVLGDAARTAESGVERSIESRLFPFYSGRIGCWGVRQLARVQRLFYSRDWGISYLVEAVKTR